MSFKRINIQKFDSSGNYVLHKDYILSYSYSDGFTERLYNIDIYIDVIFGGKVDLHFHKWGKKDSKKIEEQFDINVPDEIKNLIILLTEQKELRLRNYYSDVFMEDCNKEDFVINHGGVSHNIGVGIMIKKIVIENESEELFFRLYEQFKKWKEEIYNEILSKN